MKPSGIPMIWTGRTSYFYGDGANGVCVPILSFGFDLRAESRQLHRIKARESWAKKTAKVPKPSADTKS